MSSNILKINEENSKAIKELDERLKILERVVEKLEPLDGALGLSEKSNGDCPRKKIQTTLQYESTGIVTYRPMKK